MEPAKNTSTEVSYPCFARKDRKHCLHYEEDGYCCYCKTWAPEMCQKGCGQPEDQHLDEHCTPLITDEELELDLVAHLRRQQAFSFRTFGPPGEGQKHQGVIDHIKKELVEIEEDPSNLGEWVDMMLLSFDGAIKGGHSPEAIVRALTAKQTKNERRKWPDWRTADLTKAIEHDRTGEPPKTVVVLSAKPPSDANGSPIDE